MKVSWNEGVSEHRDCLSVVIYSPNSPCWLVDNGMQLNLLLIRVLMCVIKYIAMSQLENTGAIHHFNWYPARATWAHHLPSVLPKWSLLVERRRECGVFLLEPVHWLYVCVCVCVYVYIEICAFLSYGTFEKSIVTSHYKAHISHDTNAFCLLNGNVFGDANAIHCMQPVQAITLNKP